MNPVTDFCDFVRLAMQLSQLNLDATFAYFIKPVIFGTLAARVAGVPHRVAMIEGAGYVFTDGNDSTIAHRLLRGFVTRLYRLGLSQAHCVFMLNRDDKKLFVDEKMIDAQKIELIDGIGLELDRYLPAPLMTRPVCFTLVARLLKEKGIYEYVAAARLIKAEHPEVRFVLVGNVDDNPGSIAKSEVKEWVQEGIVEWPGHVEDVRAWLAQASVFVLPSYREGLPRSTQEAMAMGRPVITTDVPGCRETVQQDVNGFIVPVRDEEALARAMRRFIVTPELIAEMGGRSREIAEKRFDARRINDHILNVISSLASHSSEN
jgi:glycosyltransferase involved in cell wall biosynthesis